MFFFIKLNITTHKQPLLSSIMEVVPIMQCQTLFVRHQTTKASFTSTCFLRRLDHAMYTVLSPLFQVSFHRNSYPTPFSISGKNHLSYDILLGSFSCEVTFNCKISKPNRRYKEVRKDSKKEEFTITLYFLLKMANIQFSFME